MHCVLATRCTGPDSYRVSFLCWRSPLIFASATATLFGIWDQFSVWSGIATAPIFAWELSLGVWLVVKGFRPSPVTAGMLAADTPPAYRDAAAV
jgi:hypothetical protein